MLANLDNADEIISVKLQPLILPILNSFTAVHDNLKGAALIALFDCVGVFAEIMGERLRSQEVVNVLIPLLSRKW